MGISERNHVTVITGSSLQRKYQRLRRSPFARDPRRKSRRENDRIVRHRRSIYYRTRRRSKGSIEGYRPKIAYRNMKPHKVNYHRRKAAPLRRRKYTRSIEWFHGSVAKAFTMHRRRSRSTIGQMRSDRGHFRLLSRDRSQFRRHDRVKVASRRLRESGECQCS